MMKTRITTKPRRRGFQAGGPIGGQPLDQLESRTLMTTGLVELGLMPGADPDGNGLVVASQVSLVGQTQPRAIVGLVVQSSHGGPSTASSRWTRADGNGQFRFPVRLQPGETVFKAQAWAGGQQLGEATVSVTHADAVLNWNATALQTIRSEGTPPPLAALELGMTHVAIHDAFQAIARQNQPILVRVPAPASPHQASAIAAASQAAFEVLSAFYPDQKPVFEASLREALAVVPNGRAEQAGKILGRQVGHLVLEMRSDQTLAATAITTTATADLALLDTTQDQPGPGDWVPTPPRYSLPLLPQWGDQQPMGISSTDEFQVADFPTLTSAQYAAELQQVQELGRTTNSARTDDQTAIAYFWANGAGTFTPPGHWNQIAREASLANRLSFSRNVRLFAILDMALCDAGIVAWNIKYDTARWRPITAIHEADTDGNPQTEPEPTWTPLLNTPPFPTYVSGHSTFSGAAEAVLDQFIGRHYAFTDQGDPTEGLAPRSFTSFRQAAEESGISRIYGGIHFQADNVEGLRIGREIGRAILRRYPGR